MINLDEPGEIRRRLIEIDRKKVSAMSVIEKLHPFVEEIQNTGSVILKRKLESHALLFNKIYNDIIDKGQAEQNDVIELRMTLRDLAQMCADLKNYIAAKKVIDEN